MALETDVLGINDVERAEILERVESAESGGKGRRIGKSMAGLIGSQNHITSAGKFNGKTVLRFTGVDVAMRRHNARRGIFLR